MSVDFYFMKKPVPFMCAENAWLWCCKCRMDLTFANNRDISDVEDILRPCQTIDIYCVIKTLRQKNELKNYHIQSLIKYGEQLRAPSKIYKDPMAEIDYWNEAMEKLTLPMRKKGFIK